MIDTPNNKRKMIHYILGMQRATDYISDGDDAILFVEDIADAVDAIKTDWGISDIQIEKARKYMNGIK